MKTLLLIFCIAAALMIGCRVGTDSAPAPIIQDEMLPSTTLNEIINDTRQLNYFNYKNTYRSVKRMYVSQGEGC